MLSRMPEALGGNAAIANADVVLATCVASGGETLSKLIFEMVLIDETAQSTEPSCLVPLAHGCRQLVLVGDHRQLRPTVVSDEAMRRGLSLSLFERLVRHGVVPLMLDTQYRMHRSLAEFVSARFYRGKLLSGTADEARPPPSGVPWPRRGCAAALIDTATAEEGIGESKRNPGEALIVTKLLRSILGAGDLAPSDIGVVTPYAAQVALIRQHTAALPGGRAIEVMTVDGFQGREKELILFSAVRCNRAGHLGFVSDARRLNVMLTRARRGLVVVGDSRTLVFSRHWADWLQWMERQQAVMAISHAQVDSQVMEEPAASTGLIPYVNWRMPSRPPRSRRDRSPSSDVDEEGRRRRWCGEDSGSDEEKKPAAGFGAGVISRRERRRREREARRAFSGDDQSNGEDEWKKRLRAAQRQQDEALDVSGGDILPPPPEDTAIHWVVRLAAEPNAPETSATTAAAAATGNAAAVSFVTSAPSTEGRYVATASSLVAGAPLLATHSAYSSSAAFFEEEAEYRDYLAKVGERSDIGRLVRQKLASGSDWPHELTPAIPEAPRESLTPMPDSSLTPQNCLLPNWRAVRDETNGAAFFFCALTGETSIEPPIFLRTTT